MKSAELFAGYGGLALAVEAALGAETTWVTEWEDEPSRILSHHWPEAPNHRDVTTIDWNAVEPVDIISGGSPCQDISQAGKRDGMVEGTRSNLWVSMREAIAAIRPRLVVWENVRGAYSARAFSDMEPCQGCLGAGGGGKPVLRALGRVLGDLASLGYDAQWRGLRASDVGAPHQRYRVFVLAHRPDAFRFRWDQRPEETGPCMGLRESGDAERLGRRDRGGSAADALLPTPRSSQGASSSETVKLPPKTTDAPRGTSDAERMFGLYAPLITRWERVTGHPAPDPLVAGVRGGWRLSPHFTEWMMGLPPGWVTDRGLSQASELRMLGNGVVPQQATTALMSMAANITNH